MTTGTIREAVAVFDDPDSLEAAVIALEFTWLRPRRIQRAGR